MINKFANGSIIWQLYNHCSSAFVQTYFKHADASGHQASHCLTDFIVEFDSKHRLRLKNIFTENFICFNKRQRIAIRRDGLDEKCHFRERITPSGYTQLQSAWRPYLFLGFNRRGRFQDPSQFKKKKRCFSFTKLVRHASSSSVLLNECSNPQKEAEENEKINLEAERQRLLYNAVRESLLGQIRVRP
ncbi:unnamed protein product [Dracunculus medinensis]|uniref:Uncharacterized protein n=1 Tax=Dracunculus medinensis TaxID=318479 RepID=A0A0N4U537_DRAME|nr:unnamed protein product [Dracunculus medinensis]